MGFVYETGFTEQSITLNSDDLLSIHSLLLWLTLISTILLYPLVTIRYMLRIKWLQSKKLLPSKATIVSTGSIYYLLLELMVYNLIPTPFYSSYTFHTYNKQTNLETVYSYNEFFSLLVLLRVVMVFRILLGNSRYYSNSAHRICSLTGCDNGYFFVMKILMKHKPLEVLSTALLLSILTFAYALKVCERPLIYAISQRDHIFPVPNDVSNYYNALWLTIVTMTTVGYGDYFPRTIPGRAIAFFSCMFGVVVVSLMTIILSNFLEMSNSESRSYTIIEKIMVEKEKKTHAGFVITNLSKLGFWKGFLDKKVGGKTIENYVKKLKTHLKAFKGLSKENQGIFAMRTTEEEISRHFMFLKEDHKLLEGKVNELCERNLCLLDKLGCLPNEEGEDSMTASLGCIMYTPWLKRQKIKNLFKENEEEIKKNEEEIENEVKETGNE